MGDEQPEAGSLATLLGSKERLEDMFDLVAGDSRAIVAYEHLN